MQDRFSSSQTNPSMSGISPASPVSMDETTTQFTLKEVDDGSTKIMSVEPNTLPVPEKDERLEKGEQGFHVASKEGESSSGKSDSEKEEDDFSDDNSHADAQILPQKTELKEEKSDSGKSDSEPDEFQADSVKLESKREKASASDSGKSDSENEFSADDTEAEKATSDATSSSQSTTQVTPQAIAENTKIPTFPGVTRIKGDIVFGKVLGSGAFGQVYKGEWGDRSVALKKIDMANAKQNILYGQLHTTGLLESLEWEVSRLSTVNHPNCVQFYGLYEHPVEKQIYLVMEFCDQGTLGGVLEKKQVSWPLRWQWALEISQGLAYLHHDGVLHRDLKAENILIDRHHCAKLADLGVAQADALLSEHEAKAVETGLQDLTFISPEALRAMVLAARSGEEAPKIQTAAMDMYALGFVFWQMVTGGKKPRQFSQMEKSELETWLRGESGYEREPIPANCPPEWRQLILDCWQRKPENRPTAEGLIKRLQGILAAQHEQPAILQTCEALDELVHPKRLDALSYIAPYLTADRVDEPIETYWKRFGTLPTQTTATASTASTSRATTAATQAPTPTPQSNPPLDLEETLKAFLEKPTNGVLLLLGEAGLGKTLTTYRLADQLLQQWRDHLAKPDTASSSSSSTSSSTSTATSSEPPYLPIFIRPTLKQWSHRALTDAFTQAKQRYDLEKTPNIRFLVIVDGYDECQLDIAPQNLCQQLGLVNEPSVKVLVTCRPHTVDPFELRNRFGLAGHLDIRYFLPFHFNQVLYYLEKQLGWDKPTRVSYAKKLNQAEKLRSVLRNPFVLQLFVQSWETLITAESSEKDFETLDRSKIYAGFITHWLKTQQRLLDKGVQKALTNKDASTNPDLTDLIDSFWRFSSDVAFMAFQQKGITLDAPTVQALPSRWGHLKAEVEKESEQRFKARQANLTQSTQRRALLTEDDFKHIMLSRLNQFQAGSPLKEKTFGYEFSHKSFFEYFVAQRILALATLDRESAVKEGLNLLNTRPIQEEPEVLDFLIEGWTKETADTLTPIFFAIITASRRNPKVGQAAANAATILNACRISFSGEDLNHVHLPGADLSQAMLDNTCLHGANLQNVTLSRAFLRETDLTHADLMGAQFGEFPSIEYQEYEGEIKYVAYSKDGKFLAILLAAGSSIELWQGDGVKEIATLQGHTSTVDCVAFDPSGQRLVSGSRDRTLRLWEAATGKSLATLEGHTSSVSCVAFDPQGQRLVSGSVDKTLRLWEAATGKPVATLKGHTNKVTCVAFDPIGTRLVSGSEDKTLRLWEAATGKSLATLKGHMDRVNCVAFDPSGQRVVSGSYDRTLRLWEAATGKSVATLEGHTHWVTCVAFDPQGQRLVSGSMDKTLRLWEASAGKPVATLEGHTYQVTCVAFDPQGQRLVSGSGDKTLRLWEAATGKLVAMLEGHTNSVTCVAFDPSGQRLVSGSGDKTLRLWEAVATSKPAAMLEGHTHQVSCVAFDPIGTRLVSGSWDNTLRLWEAATGKPVATLKGHTSTVNCVAFDPQGQRLVSGSVDKTLRLWEAATGKSLATLEGHMSSVTCVAFDPSGQRLVSGGGRTLRLWEAATGKSVATLEGHTREVTCVAFDPQGQRLVSGSFDTTLRLWEAATGKSVATLEGHTYQVTCVAFDPIGTRLVSGSFDTTLRLWEAATGKSVATLEGHTQGVSCVAFDPSGQRLVSGSGDKTLRLWEAVATSKPAAMLEGHTREVTCVAFDPQGQRVVSGSNDNTLRLWEAVTGKSVATLKGHTDRVTCVTFDPSGQRLVSGSGDKSILLWQSVQTDRRKCQILYRLTASWPLTALGAFLQGTQLSAQNKKLLLQCQAKDETPYPSPYLENSASEESTRHFVSFWTRGANDAIPVSISKPLEEVDQQSLGCVNQTCYGFFTARRQQMVAAQTNPNPTRETPQLTG